MIAQPKRNSWQAAPTWFKVIWWFLFVGGIYLIIGLHLIKPPMPRTSVGLEFSQPEYVAAREFGLIISTLSMIWIYFRLRSETGPAARGAPWGVVAFVLHGWTWGVTQVAGSIVDAFVYDHKWLVWLSMTAALGVIALLGAHALENKRLAGIVLFAVYLIGGLILSIARSLYNGAPTEAVVFVSIFSIAIIAILLYCLFRPSVFAWVRGSDNPLTEVS